MSDFEVQKPIDDELLLLDDEEQEEIIDASKRWKVLIIDDEQEVHNITKMVLSDFTFEGKGIEFISGYSAKDGKRLINDNPDTALIFMDVVMEEDDSGLQLVKYIRETVRNNFVRIILRTGQPGYAPEEKIIQNYDINDYKEKTELTARKIFTSMVSSLRSYRDMIKLEENRRGLQRIIEATAGIFEFKSICEFAAGILVQLITILRLNEKDSPAQVSSFTAAREEDGFYILAATGNYQENINDRVQDVVDEKALSEIGKVLEDRKSHYSDDTIILYFRTVFNSENIIYLRGTKKLEDMDIELIEIFAANVATSFDNIYLNKEIEDTQTEIIFSLGEIAEARSKETGSHVKRVAEYSRLLAREYGLSEEEAELIYIASTMHDVGKLSVPDSILNKPGRLTPEEFEIIKLHSKTGYDMLKKSNRPAMKMAAIIALQHHERYNGKGYPSGLRGEEIHIAGRISALADVFDALGSERVYKPAWELKDILEHLQKEKGEHFDPKLIDIFFENLDKFIRIRDEFND